MPIGHAIWKKVYFCVWEWMRDHEASFFHSHRKSQDYYCLLIEFYNSTSETLIFAGAAET